MTKLRKEKELEIFSEFQRHQERMRDRLHTQQQQATTDEDERIAQAMAEKHAKRDVSLNNAGTIGTPSKPPVLTVYQLIPMDLCCCDCWYVHILCGRLRNWLNSKSLWRPVEIFTITC